ncbi:MAG: hypothetical protein LC808_27020, partial [Actinobacteria bacterium]|nr:hypothetical protein [Actinomycetota bacterium]
FEHRDSLYDPGGEPCTILPAQCDWPPPESNRLENGLNRRFEPTHPSVVALLTNDVRPKTEPRGCVAANNAVVSGELLFADPCCRFAKSFAEPNWKDVLSS